MKVLEIQGKQYIVTEVDSRFIDTDGTDYQIGIAAPDYLPFVVLSYPTTVLAEDCAAIADWTEAMAGARGIVTRSQRTPLPV